MLTLNLVVILVKTTSRHFLDEEVLEDCERSPGNPQRVKKVLYLLQQESRQRQMVQNAKFTAKAPLLNYRYLCGTAYTYL